VVALLASCAAGTRPSGAGRRAQPVTARPELHTSDTFDVGLLLRC